ncbi:hypothetical protein BAC1_00444 [uncultured bacterium]|nr:hypothetical protein BAC1_00444 [uncultured bacterium]
MRFQKHREITPLFSLLAIVAALAGCGDLALDPDGVVSGSITASSVSTGDNHSCAVSSGNVKCWGLNTSGQLGNNSTASALSAVLVSGITDAVQVSAGSRHTCARLSNGTVWCWGDNVEGQLGNGTNADSLVPVQATGITGAIDLSSGGNHTCMVRADGSAWCWGRNTEGQLGNSSNIDSNLPVPVSGMTNAGKIAAGGAHTCARLLDFTVECWGSNVQNQLGNTGILAASRNFPVAVSNMTTAVSISAGANHNCAVVTSPSGVKCWGSDVNGQLARSWVPAIFPSPAITSFPDAQFVAGINTPSGVAAGFAHSCAALTNNTIRCWGENFDGQLGNGNFFGFFPPDPNASATSTVVPVGVSGISSAVEVAAGQFHSCARLFNGEIRCWGRNSSGQLGDGTGIFSSTPVRVTDNTGTGLMPTIR